MVYYHSHNPKDCFRREADQKRQSEKVFGLIKRGNCKRGLYGSAWFGRLDHCRGMQKSIASLSLSYFPLVLIGAGIYDAISLSPCARKRRACKRLRFNVWR